jgi:hypothetical protein
MEDGSFMEAHFLHQEVLTAEFKKIHLPGSTIVFIPTMQPKYKQAEKTNARFSVRRCRSLGALFGSQQKPGPYKSSANNTTASLTPTIPMKANAPSSMLSENKPPTDNVRVSSQENSKVVGRRPPGKSNKQVASQGRNEVMAGSPNRRGLKIADGNSNKEGKGFGLLNIGKINLPRTKNRTVRSQRKPANKQSTFSIEKTLESSSKTRLSTATAAFGGEKSTTTSVGSEVMAVSTAGSDYSNLVCFGNGDKKSKSNSLKSSELRKSDHREQNDTHNMLQLDPSASEFTPSGEPPSILPRAAESTIPRSRMHNKGYDRGVFHFFRPQRGVRRDPPLNGTPSSEERHVSAQIARNARPGSAKDGDCSCGKRTEAKVPATARRAPGAKNGATLPPTADIIEIEGVKVTRVDRQSAVFVVDLVPPQICDLILQLTNEHVLRSDSQLGRATWRKLYTYTTMDIPCREVCFLGDITDQIIESVVRIIGKLYGYPVVPADLRPRTWKEPHLLRYQKVEGLPVHTGTELHWDGSHITWQLMLSEQIEYTGKPPSNMMMPIFSCCFVDILTAHNILHVGGGTYFSCMRRIINLKKGQVLIHPGSLYHKGVDITSGVRTLLVCFMDWFQTGKAHDNAEWTNQIKAWEERISRE